jgi:hypothetical protein
MPQKRPVHTVSDRVRLTIDLFQDSGFERRIQFSEVKWKIFSIEIAISTPAAST